MSEARSELGGRLPLLDPASLDGDGRALVTTLEATWVPQADATPFRAKAANGSFIGPFNPFLYSPVISAAFVAFQMVEARESSLDPRVRQAVILSVGSAWQAAYEIYAHEAAARTVGFAEAEIACLASGWPCSTLRREEALASAVALALSKDRYIDDDLFRAARDVFGHRGLVEIVLLVGNYLVICSLLNAFDIPAPGAMGS